MKNKMAKRQRRIQARNNHLPINLPANWYKPPKAVTPVKTAPAPCTGLCRHAAKVLRQMVNGRRLVANESGGFRLEFINDLGKLVMTTVRAKLIDILRAAKALVNIGGRWMLTADGRQLAAAS